MDACKKGDSGTQDDWGRGGERSWDVLGWMVMERDMLTVQELPAICSQSRDAFLSPSLLGCLSPLLVPSPKWSWLESSVWGGGWRISSLWVGLCPNYSFSFCMTFAVSCGESPCPFSAFQVRCRISAALQLLLWAAPFVSAWPPALLWWAGTAGTACIEQWGWGEMCTSGLTQVAWMWMQSLGEEVAEPPLRCCFRRYVSNWDVWASSGCSEKLFLLKD